MWLEEGTPDTLLMCLMHGSPWPGLYKEERRKCVSITTYSRFLLHWASSPSHTESEWLNSCVCRLCEVIFRIFLLSDIEVLRRWFVPRFFLVCFFFILTVWTGSLPRFLRAASCVHSGDASLCADQFGSAHGLDGIFTDYLADKDSPPSTSSHDTLSTLMQWFSTLIWASMHFFFHRKIPIAHFQPKILYTSF